MLINVCLYNFEHLINTVAEDGNNVYYPVIVCISFVCDALSADTAIFELCVVKSSIILCWIDLPYEKLKVEKQSSSTL